MDESGRLPGAIALASPCTRPNMFGAPGLAAKSSISLLSRKPVPPAHHAGAEAAVDRVGDRDGVAVAVDDGECVVCGCFRAAARRREGRRGRGARARSARGCRRRSPWTAAASSGLFTKSGSPRTWLRSTKAWRIASTMQVHGLRPSGSPALQIGSLPACSGSRRAWCRRSWAAARRGRHSRDRCRRSGGLRVPRCSAAKSAAVRMPPLACSAAATAAAIAPL